ncbi:hypothetical protein QR680_009726 [Steinernema hermaphroditum]|uniref:Carboxylic ester hydrolase n=1 Tax=Steinernema hermaphroditum TaxID=289476 RepID=A0AA39M9F2_9BILA|nr:hypothetical protein QR680_009726 [Steinernema hermaphroditum]
MEKILFIVLLLAPLVVGQDCPEGWFFAQDHCYHIYCPLKPWKEAEAYCQQHGGHLASIHSQKEVDLLLQRSEGFNNLWIGASSTTTPRFKWIDESTWDYENWLFPENARADSCISTLGKWTSVQCDMEFSAMFLFCDLALSRDVEVETKFGRIEGFRYELKDGNSTDVFLGIPFSERPKRFQRARLVSPWMDKKEAKHFGPSCPATMPWLMDAGLEFAEECLFMNVIAPSRPSRGRSGYPVVVWVQGGGFELGTSTVYGYKNISENFVSRDVVFVTFNYRLGPFGFLSTGDDAAPGNVGLWDQILALQFVNEIISDFGGDPTNVTVFGESAGAAAVSLLTLSPHSSGLFQKAITISGSSFSNFAINERVVEESLRLAQFLECEGTSKEIVECLRTRSIDELYSAFFRIGPARDRLLGFHYSPRFDSDFFPLDSLNSLVEVASPIPTLAMITSSEMGIFTMNNLDMNLIDVDPSRIEDYNEDDLREVMKKIARGTPGLEEELLAFYISRGDGEERNSTFYLSRLTQLASDIMFNVPPLQEAEMKSAFSWPVFLGEEAYYTREEGENIPIEGAFHGNELSYLFDPQTGSSYDGSSDSRKFKGLMIETIVSFANTGVPTSYGQPWKPVDARSPRRYVELSTRSEEKEGLMEESYKFWTQELPNKVGVESLKALLPALKLDRETNVLGKRALKKKL